MSTVGCEKVPPHAAGSEVQSSALFCEEKEKPNASWVCEVVLVEAEFPHASAAVTAVVVE
jgi:hypothetical protein